ncbi:MAG: 2-phospho-L-lactate transferase [Chloroflexi bacterium]|nr:2-phospho-L-lactate transferase [Chloroflexota bacterium]
MRAVALAGGVGGARLAHGLQRVLAPGELVVVVNVADDLERHGLVVSPDQDTVLYTLAGLADRERGWGLAGETWSALDQLGRLGEETWFAIGDRDLALHVVRTARLRAGARPTEVALELAARLGVPSRILPVTDDTIRTRVRTPDGWLDFQDYFVRLRCEPEVLEVTVDGAARARPTPEVLASLATAERIVVCPSNPVVSIGPIMAVPGMPAAVRAARDRGVPVVAVSPIVAGRALRGPADRMLVSLGGQASVVEVARRYVDLADILVIDEADAGLAGQVAATGIRPLVAPTVMTDDAARAELARAVLAAA